VYVRFLQGGAIGGWPIVLAVVVVSVGNIDSIAIALSLYANSATRAVPMQQINAQDFCSTPDDEARCVLEAANFLEAIAIPLGWSAPNPSDGTWGLAAEGPRSADLGWCCSARCAILVSPAGSSQHSRHVRHRTLGYHISTRLP
jgi:hypothetical protein